MQATTTPTGEYADLTASWLLHLGAANASVHTRRVYGHALRSLYRALAEAGMPTHPDSISREHVETWLQDLHTRRKPATASLYFIAIRAWFRWLLAEGEISRNPAERIAVPKIGEQATPHLDDTQLRALLAACSGPSFTAKRDAALLRLLIDTGLRRAEVVGIREDDLDWASCTIRVLGKGRRHRLVHFGLKTAQALDRYRRARRRHPHAARPELWLDRNGPMSVDAVYAAIRRRGELAGLGRTWPHMLRHVFAHRYLEKGGQEGDLMRLAGWTRRETMARYTEALGTERAIEAHRRLAPADDL